MVLQPSHFLPAQRLLALATTLLLFSCHSYMKIKSSSKVWHKLTKHMKQGDISHLSINHKSEMKKSTAAKVRRERERDVLRGRGEFGGGEGSGGGVGRIGGEFISKTENSCVQIWVS